MKILHIILGLGKGGAERLLVDSLPQYVDMGFQVDVLQLSSRYEYQGYSELLKAGGIGVYTLSEGSARNIVLVLKLRSFLKKNRYDVVHVHLFPSLYYAILATRLFYPRPKLIFTEHSSQNGRSTKKFLFPVERYIYNKYDQVIAVSEMIKNRLEANLKIKNASVVKNGVSLDIFSSAESYPKSFLANSYGIRPDATVILMVARFSYPKDHVTALKALVELPEKFVLFLVGDGSGLQKIKQMAGQLNISQRVFFLEFRMDVPRLMKSADFVILPSIYEGMSGVTLEAMASRTNYLGADVLGINDIVPDRQYLFKKNDPKELSKRILELAAQNKRSEILKSRAYSHVQQFSLDKMVHQYAEIYQGLNIDLDKSLHLSGAS